MIYSQIVQFLTRLVPSKTVKDVILNLLQEGSDEERARGILSLNLPKLIAIAKSLNIINRVYEYPVYIPNSHFSPSNFSGLVHQGSKLRSSSDLEESSSLNSQSAFQFSTSVSEKEKVRRNSADAATESGGEVKVFHKFISRTRSVVGKSNRDKEEAQAYSVKDIVHLLNGQEHLDSLCCKYELSFSDFVTYPGIKFIYR